MTNLEIADNTDCYSSACFDKITGFFEAPVNGAYQFHMACDDYCHLYMSLTDPMDPSTMELLQHRDYHTSFRNFGSHTYENTPNNVDISEATTVAGISWTDLKLGSMDSGYDSSGQYNAFSTDDQALVDALIQA